MNANMWFKNMDKIRNYFNSNASYGLNILYSTPSCYLKAVHDAAETAGQAWTTKTDDFFPYASDPHAYWTGYFTSRPALKGMIRQANSLLQAAKQVNPPTVHPLCRYTPGWALGREMTCWRRPRERWQ